MGVSDVDVAPIFGGGAGAAAAVAVIAVLGSVLTYVLVRGELRGEVDRSLRAPGRAAQRLQARRIAKAVSNSPFLRASQDQWARSDRYVVLRGLPPQKMRRNSLRPD